MNLQPDKNRESSPSLSEQKKRGYLDLRCREGVRQSYKRLKVFLPVNEQSGLQAKREVALLTALSDLINFKESNFMKYRPVIRYNLDPEAGLLYYLGRALPRRRTVGSVNLRNLSSLSFGFYHNLHKALWAINEELDADLVLSGVGQFLQSFDGYTVLERLPQTGQELMDETRRKIGFSPRGGMSWPIKTLTVNSQKIIQLSERMECVQAMISSVDKPHKMYLSHGVIMPEDIYLASDTHVELLNWQNAGFTRNRLVAIINDISGLLAAAGLESRVSEKTSRFLRGLIADKYNFAMAAAVVDAVTLKSIGLIAERQGSVSERVIDNIEAALTTV